VRKALQEAKQQADKRTQELIDDLLKHSPDIVRQETERSSESRDTQENGDAPRHGLPLISRRAAHSQYRQNRCDSKP